MIYINLIKRKQNISYSEIKEQMSLRRAPGAPSRSLWTCHFGFPPIILNFLFIFFLFIFFLCKMEKLTHYPRAYGIIDFMYPEIIFLYVLILNYLIILSYPGLSNQLWYKIVKKRYPFINYKLYAILCKQSQFLETPI